MPFFCAVVALTACGDLKARFSKPKTGFDGQAALGYVQRTWHSAHARPARRRTTARRAGSSPR
jgi:hypothetical protein